MKKYGRRGGQNENGQPGTGNTDDSSEYKDAYSNLSKSALV